MTRFIAINLRKHHTWRMRLIATIAVAAALVSLPGPVAADDVEEALKAVHQQYAGKVEMYAAQSDGMTLSQATAMIRKRTGGQIVGAETKVQGGREVHYIKVLKDGRVKTHKVNGKRR